MAPSQTFAYAVIAESVCWTGESEEKGRRMMQGGEECLPCIHLFNKMPHIKSYARYWKYKVELDVIAAHWSS